MRMPASCAAPSPSPTADITPSPLSHQAHTQAQTPQHSTSDSHFQQTTVYTEFEVCVTAPEVDSECFQQ